MKFYVGFATQKLFVLCELETQFVLNYLDRIILKKVNNGAPYLTPL
jgi:hypothetical protein